MSKQLSVILPNYNHAKYLRQAIDAIAEQSRPPDEIIVIDDASLDDSLEVLALAQGKHPNLVVLANKRNIGAVLALQQGLDAARGRYIYFAAADDQVLPGFFRQAIEALEAEPSLGLFCGETILFDGGTGRKIGTRPVVRPLRSAGSLSPRDVEELLKRADNFINTGSSVFRRQAVLDKGGFITEAGSFSDGLLARKIALTLGIWFAPVPVATWRIHSDGLSQTTALDRNRALGALFTLPKLIESDRDFPAWYPELFQRRWRFGSCRLALLQTPPNIDLLIALAPNMRCDRAVIGMLKPYVRYRLARIVLLTWLSLRLRPFRIRDIAVTAFDRWCENRARRRRLE